MVVKAKFRGTTVVVKRAIPPARPPLARRSSVVSASSLSYSNLGAVQRERSLTTLARQLSFHQKKVDMSSQEALQKRVRKPSNCWEPNDKSNHSTGSVALESRTRSTTVRPPAVFP
jgi:hypothetical protein